MSRAEARPDDETTLGAFHGATEAVDDAQPADDPNVRTAPAWTPQSGQQCQNCGSHITHRFRRTLGDQDDLAHACPECATKEQIYLGAASDPDFELDADGPARMGGQP